MKKKYEIILSSQDLSQWSSVVTSWYNTSFHQVSYLLLQLKDEREKLSSPYLTDPDLLHCEVTIPHTEYKEIVSRKFLRDNIGADKGDDLHQTEYKW